MPLDARPMRGIILILLAYATFAWVDISAKWLAQAGYLFIQIAFLRFFGHTILAAIMLYRHRGFGTLFTVSRPLIVVIRSCVLIGATLLNFLALSKLSLAVSGALMFSSPLFICILSIPLLGERIGPWRWSAIAIGLIGVMIVMRPFTDAFNPAVLFSLGAVTCYSFYVIITRYLAGTAPSDMLQFYAGLAGCLIIGPFAVLTWRNPDNLLDAVVMVAIGILGWCGHQIFITAHHYAEAGVLAPFAYVSVLYLTLASWLIFSAPPDRWTLIGSFVVTAAGLVVWLRERHKAQI